MSAPTVPDCFRTAIAERLGNLRHRSPDLQEAEGSILVSEAGMSLLLQLEAGTEIVSDASFQAPEDSAEAAVLDELCAFAIDAPVREVVEHGLIYAMNALRDPDIPAPVQGILTPRNAGTHFTAPLRLLSLLRREAEARFGRHTDTNFFDRPYSDNWKALGEEGKRNLVLPLIAGFKQRNGYADASFSLAEIDQYDRLFLVFGDEIAVWDKPRILMDLAHWLRAQTGERIELFAEVAKDANRIRRL